MSKQEDIRPSVQTILIDNPLASITTITELLKDQGVEVSHMTVHRVATSLREDVMHNSKKAMRITEGTLSILELVQRRLITYLQNRQDDDTSYKPLLDISAHLLQVLSGMDKKSVKTESQINLPKLSIEDMRKIVKGDMTPLEPGTKKTGGSIDKNQ